ncbi:conserved phage C-terminal domain-containing protein [Clostridium gasigenes]|uniref:conserved phage C-terminal domain-containing protein n=1 Tax=Clostridium gasigenes TaxID=94869 RepID=UPI001C0ABFAF|nr:conserved phage C-terminal domain-containing protein [Clostridium gasigenes]MBU3137702.1 conserved phage C-terminal domain-containing protein [Clostridium gasigenes]
MDRAFKGVWIPAKVWLDKGLTLTEKVFLVEISSLDGINGCYAENTHFMTFSGLSKGRCSGVIKALKTKGYINIKMIYKNDNETVERRIIKVNEDKFEGKTKGENMENIETGQAPLINEIYEENKSLNINLRDIKINTKETSVDVIEDNETNDSYKNLEEHKQNSFSNEEAKASNDNRNSGSEKPLYHYVIEYLNMRCGTNYNVTTVKNQKLINARIKEGYGLEDFQNIISAKANEWLDSDMEKYLRPETLFGTKFEGYVNEFNMNRKSCVINNNLESTAGNFNGYRDNRLNQGNGEEEKASRWSQGSNTSNRSLTAEEREWAERELF